MKIIVNGKKYEMNEETYEELKKWDKNLYFEFYLMVLEIYQSEVFRALPIDCQKKVYHHLELLNQTKFSSVRELELCLVHYYDFFMDMHMINNQQVLAYLDILFDYPEFPLAPLDFLNYCQDQNDPKLVTYLRIEAKFEAIVGEDFASNLYEDILLNEDLRNMGLTDVMVNGIINSSLSKKDLVYSIDRVLNDFSITDALIIIEQFFRCPTDRHLMTVVSLVSFQRHGFHDHFLEMVDMIIHTKEEDLAELQFRIMYQIQYVEMTFEEASKNRKYHHEAMKILDESSNIKSYSRIRIPIYTRRQ